MSGQTDVQGDLPPKWPEPRERTLQVRLRIVPSNACLVKAIDGVSELRLYRSEKYYECDVVTSVSEGKDDHQRVVHGRQSLDSSCVCAVFAQHDVVPEVTNVDGDSFDVSLFVPTSAIARETFDELSSTADQVELLSVSGIGEEHPVKSRCAINRSALTRKQRTALELAIEHGYYESPREVTLDSLAEELDISVSAVAKRLRAAERNVLCQLVGGVSDGRER